MAHPQEKLERNTSEFDERLARLHVETLPSSLSSQESACDVPAGASANAKQTGAIGRFGSTSAAALFLLGIAGASVHFLGVLATLAACVAIILALVMWGFWVLDNTIEL